MKYIIRHYLNVDATAEVIVDESEIDINLNDLKEHKKPTNNINNRLKSFKIKNLLSIILNNAPKKIVGKAK